MKLVQGWSKETCQKIFVVVMFTLSALYGTSHYYIMRQKGLLKEWTSKIATLNDEIKEAEKMADTARKEAPHRQKVESFVETHRKAMISGDPFAWVVREITLLAEKHPIRVQGLRPGAATEVALKNRYATFGLEISLSGRYDQIGTFVADLENHFATGNVRSLTLTPASAGEISGVLQMMLLVVPEAKTLQPVANAAATPPKGES